MKRLVSGLLAAAAVVVLGCGSTAPTASDQQALPAINARLLALTAQFGEKLPTKSQVAQFFEADGFYQNGLALDEYLGTVLLEPRAGPSRFDYVGFTFDDLKLDQWVDPNHVFVTYTASVSHPDAGTAVRFRPWTERMLMTLSGGQWRLSGNRQIARTSVNFRVRLGEKPLTQAELDARPDVFTAVQDWDPLKRAAYLMYVPAPPGPDLIAWLGFPGDANFGVVGWVGDNFDDVSTPDVNERELRREYNQYLATSSGKVKAYMVFEVSSVEIDPRVAYVHVTGPGLPSVGLGLVRSEPEIPREYLIFRGDPTHWNAFSTLRCAEMAKVVDDPNDPRDYIPDCALDWSQIASGSRYLYAFHDAVGNVLGETTLEVKGDVLGEEGWYAERDRLIGQLTLAPAYQFTIASVLDTSAGSPFVGGGTVALEWRPPASADVQLEGVSYWRDYFLDDAWWDPASHRQEEHWYQLRGSGATSISAASDPSPWLTGWAWSTLTYCDAHGNRFDHEVSPVNPF